jgi:hypothetical protein
MGWACNMHEKRTVEKRVLVGKSQGKRSLVRPRRRCEGNKLDLQEVGWGMDWINLAQYKDK